MDGRYQLLSAQSGHQHVSRLRDISSDNSHTLTINTEFDTESNKLFYATEYKIRGLKADKYYHLQLKDISDL